MASGEGRFEGLILQPTYRVRSGHPVLQLWGRLQAGPAFLVEDDRLRPYFFVRTGDAGRLRGDPEVLEIVETGLCDLAGEPVSRVTVPIPAAVPQMRERLEEAGVRPLEADIRFPYRCLIDLGVRAAIAIEGSYKERAGGLLHFVNPVLGAGSSPLTPAMLATLSLDLETTPDASVILSAAIVHRSAGEDGSAKLVEEVHVVARGEVDHPAARVHRDERKLVRALCERIRSLDPDLILGWNVVDFDLRVLARRCERLGLPPSAAQLGRGEGRVAFQQDRGFTRQSRADLRGRMVLDGIPLVRDAIRLQDYRLETVAQAVLGRGKLITGDGAARADEIGVLHREDPAALVAYNLEDARLVLEILDREGLLSLTLERSLLSGMQLDRVGASIASFDLLYLPELRRRGVVAPSVDTSRKSAPVRGGAVLDSQPGLVSNVALFDFKSLYPSLIRTFNLDPLAHARAGASAIEAPNGARFNRESGILPEVIAGFMQRREEARARGDRHADQAIKIMMNAMFGVFAASACRFFDADLANAITGFGQQTLAWTRDAFEAEGVRVLYGDTDSVFVRLFADPEDGGPEKESSATEAVDAEGTRGRALEKAARLRERVEKRIEDRIRREYGVEPLLTLELERVFDRFFLPRVRGGRSGSKKRYAGWVDGGLDVVGLEAVRRDWPAVARELQEGMLTRLFTGREVMPFVADLAERLRSGALDDRLVYVKRLRKGSASSYTASTPPHVQAARKAGTAPGDVVRYVITREGPEPVAPGRPLPPGIDHRHYEDKVIRPVADAILVEIGHSYDEATGQPRQLQLL